MKLLIVDDSRAARMLIKSIILDFDNDTELLEASNGEEAVTIYDSERPDVVFLDLTMPVKSGYEALQEIREINGDALVVILTADIQIKSIERCFDLGAYKVIKKLPEKKAVHELLDELKSIVEVGK